MHEREHERELVEQAAQRGEELELLKAELSEELRDSMEAAHQAELSQVQVGGKDSIIKGSDLIINQTISVVM